MNNEQRETKEIITPIGKHKIVMKTYITGKEDKEIKKIWRNIEVTIERDKQTAKPFNLGDRTDEAEKKVVELVIISINGETENIVGNILGMHKKDCTFIEKEINKITEDEDEDEEKKNNQQISE